MGFCLWVIFTPKVPHLRTRLGCMFFIPTPKAIAGCGDFWGILRCSYWRLIFSDCCCSYSLVRLWIFRFFILFTFLFGLSLICSLACGEVPRLPWRLSHCQLGLPDLQPVLQGNCQTVMYGKILTIFGGKILGKMQFSGKFYMVNICGGEILEPDKASSFCLGHPCPPWLL